MKGTLAERIIATHTEGPCEVGSVVEVQVDVAMSHENAFLVERQFRAMGGSRVFDHNRIVLLLDHRVPADSEATAEVHASIRRFAREQDIRNWYDMREGVCHQVFCEEGHARPGELVVGSDSHTTTYGALGCLSTGIGATDMAAVWATGWTWMKVPETIRVDVTGRFMEHVGAKDLALKMIGEMGADGADYRSIEFHGDTVRSMSMASRMCLANQSMEAGAKCALVPPDDVTREFLQGRGAVDPGGRSDVSISGMDPFPDAEYLDVLPMDVTDLVPLVAVPHRIDTVRPVSEIGDVPVDQAVLGSCTNGRLEDIAVAARLVAGRSIHRDTRFLVVPASRSVYLDAVEGGYIADLVRAGATILNPGCGPCLGQHQGCLAAGETAIASTNRNFMGRMGSPDASIYVSSPAVVAASAVAGHIISPEDLVVAKGTTKGAKGIGGGC